MEVRYYCDPETGLPHIYEHGVTEATMTEQRFPVGWDERRVKELIAELDSRTEEEWIAADEAAAQGDRDETVVTVPTTLLPEIRRLLAAHRTA